MVKRSESGHGQPSFLVYLVLAALLAAPPMLGAIAALVAITRHHPWWVVVLACLGGTVAGYVVAWGVGALVGWAVAP